VKLLDEKSTAGDYKASIWLYAGITFRQACGYLPSCRASHQQISLSEVYLKFILSYEVKVF